MNKTEQLIAELIKEGSVMTWCSGFWKSVCFDVYCLLAILCSCSFLENAASSSHISHPGTSVHLGVLWPPPGQMVLNFKPSKSSVEYSSSIVSCTRPMVSHSTGPRQDLRICIAHVVVMLLQIFQGMSSYSPPKRTEEGLGWGSHFVFSIQWGLLVSSICFMPNQRHISINTLRLCH